MKKLFLFLIAGFTFLIGMSFVSATLCQNSHGYYDDCSFGSSGGYKQYNTYNYAPKPIFKGSYGNYRYDRYLHGDDLPTSWFGGSGLYGAYGHPFGGGYGYYGYPAFGYGGGYGYAPFSNTFGYSSYYWYW